MFILGLEGKGRLGISISKKVLSSAVARNRIKRLIRETFRKNAKLFPKTDLNIIGRDNLSKEWKLLDYSDVQKQLISAARFVEENKKSEQALKKLAANGGSFCSGISSIFFFWGLLSVRTHLLPVQFFCSQKTWACRWKFAEYKETFKVSSHGVLWK